MLKLLHYYRLDVSFLSALASDPPNFIRRGASGISQCSLKFSQFLSGACSGIHPSFAQFYLDKNRAFGGIFGGPWLNWCVNLDRTRKHKLLVGSEAISLHTPVIRTPDYPYWGYNKKSNFFATLVFPDRFLSVLSGRSNLSKSLFLFFASGNRYLASQNPLKWSSSLESRSCELIYM